MSTPKKTDVEGALQYVNRDEIERALEMAGLPRASRIIDAVFIFGTEDSQIIGKITGVEVKDSVHLIVYTGIPSIGAEHLHCLVRDQIKGSWTAVTKNQLTETQFGVSERIGIFELLL